MKTPLIFERGDHLYLVGPLAPITPGAQEIEELAFADAIREQSTNENLLWLRGQYVEGDRPNRNGQLWTSDELAIKSLTPRLMPVTVMHDPRTAIGLIADTKLLTPEADNVPRARIDTVLALWGHRFPEVAQEVHDNYKQGTLMQSMECAIGHYECPDCGQGFVKLPENAERANWCDHLRAAAENGVPVRRLRDVTFTGSGLIFGTRSGATGALDTAHLEMFQDEVAEFHERAHKPGRRTPRRTSSMDEITLKRSEYDELKAKADKADELARRVESLEGQAGKVGDLESKVEKFEIDLKAANDAHADEKAKRERLEETARAAELSSERTEKLGSAFLAKLPDSIKTRLGDQAKVMSDEDWTARLDELAELTGVKPDEKADPEAPSGPSREETARTQLGGSTGATGGDPSRAAVATVLGGLFEQTRRPTAKPAGK